MRLIHLSDLHITEGRRLDDHARILDRIVTEAIDTCPDAWLITGDLSGRTVPHRMTPRECAVLYPQLVRMAEVAPVVIDGGNHDHALDIESLRHLGGAWSIRVVTKAEAISLSTPSGVLHCYVLPYPRQGWLLEGETRPVGIEATRRMCDDRLAITLQLWQQRIARTRIQYPEQVHVFLGHVQVRGCRTSGGEVLAGQEIELTRGQLDELRVDYGALGHLHLRQETAARYWYVGSPWRNDHAETEDFKGWHLVDVGDWDPSDAQDQTWYDEGPSRQEVRVIPMESRCREFVTLDYRWAQPEGEDRPRWTSGPASNSDPVPYVGPVQDAEVRMRLVVPHQHVAGCPWEAEIQRVRDLGAHYIQDERTIEPVLRVRSPAVAAAQTLPEKIAAYWETVGTEPTDEERAAALANLDELQTHDDEQIGALTRALLEAS